MATLDIGGTQIEIDDAFKSLPKAEQQAIVEDIASKLPKKEVAEQSMPVSGGLKTLDDLVRSVAQGATFGYADEIAAKMAQLTGIGGQKAGAKDYESLVKAERERQAAIPAAISIPGEVAGGLLTAGGLAKQGLTLLKPVGSTSMGSNIARGAGEGAIYGALSGSGEGTDAESRIIGAATGGILGAPFGAAGGAITSKLAQAAAPATSAELKAAGNQAYEAAKAMGTTFKPDSALKIAEDVRAVVKEFGGDPALQPKSMRALEILEERIPQNMNDIDAVRRIFGDVAYNSVDRSERKLATKMIEKLDEVVGGFKKPDIASGSIDAINKFNEARKIWSRQGKGEKIDKLIDRAQTRAAQYSASGEENALRTEFRQLAMNEKKMRGFSKEEADAIRRVAEGGPMENLLRYGGKLAPTGVVSGGAGVGLGYALGGPAGAAVIPALGAASRAGATALTKQNAQYASQLMRAGGSQGLQPRALSPLEMMLYRAGATQPGQLAVRGLLGQ
jgi:hypothetical protein